MTELTAYLFVALGVLVGVVLPVLANFIREEFPAYAAPGIPPWLKRYAVLFLFSLIVALVTLAIWRAQNPTGVLTWYTSFLIGFGWQSAIEKFLRPKP